jgi:hypothetical protein
MYFKYECNAVFSTLRVCLSAPSLPAKKYNADYQLHQPVLFEGAAADDGGALGAPGDGKAGAPWPKTGFDEPTTPHQTAGKASFVLMHDPEASG